MISQERPGVTNEIGQEKNLEPALFAILGARMWSPNMESVAGFINEIKKIFGPDEEKWKEIYDGGKKKEEIENLLKTHFNIPLDQSHPEEFKIANEIVFKVANHREIMLNDFTWPLVYPEGGDTTNSGMSSQKREVVTGEARIVAAGLLAKEFPGAHFVTTGAREGGPKDGKVFEKALEMSDAIVRRFKLDPNRIDPLMNQTKVNTEGDAEMVWNYIFTHPTQIPENSQIHIVTSDYHALRAWLLFYKNFYENSTGKKWEIADKEMKRRLAKILIEKMVRISKLEEEGKLLKFSSTEMQEVLEEFQYELESTFRGSKFTPNIVVAENVLKENNHKSKDSTTIPETRITLQNEYIAVLKIIFGNEWLKSNIGTHFLDYPEHIQKISDFLKLDINFSSKV